ncbi:unnamed protein product [Zymoseptoria tritici ST99CH_3D7]|uniref:Uncharacterized protein n=2 Tax=Zymoseptoria tritici TaxID=1047171 RepID=A0A1X7S4V1_ZYMT9|nr:unnamed protein product [Zymoseptoria tritici ST99CH_3D7]SMR58973.1 unnamed protein product [Zymoseptoria tritici ST99CH_1E4]
MPPHEARSIPSTFTNDTSCAVAGTQATRVGKQLPLETTLRTLCAWHETVADITAMLIEVPQSVHFPNARLGLIHLLDPESILSGFNKNTQIVNFLIHWSTYTNAARLRAQNDLLFPFKSKLLSGIRLAITCPLMWSECHDDLYHATGLAPYLYKEVVKLLGEVAVILSDGAPLSYSTYSPPEEDELECGGTESAKSSPPMSPIEPVAPSPLHTSARIKELRDQADTLRCQLAAVEEELRSLTVDQNEEVEVEDSQQQHTAPDQSEHQESATLSPEQASSAYWASLTLGEIHRQYKAAGEEAARQLRYWGDPHYAQTFAASKETRMPANKYVDLADEVRRRHGPVVLGDPRFKILIANLDHAIAGRNAACRRYHSGTRSAEPGSAQHRHLQFWAALAVTRDHLLRK